MGWSVIRLGKRGVYRVLLRKPEEKFERFRLTQGDNIKMN